MAEAQAESVQPWLVAEILMASADFPLWRKGWLILMSLPEQTTLCF